MQNRAPLAIGIVIAAGVGLGTWGISNLTTQHDEFLSKEKAFDVAKTDHQIFAGSVGSQFAYFKYNGTVNGDPQFIVTEADPDAKALSEITSKVIFNSDHFGKYLSDKLTDRFVWIYRGGNPGGSEYYVDAKTGELIGEWTPCPGCV